MGWIGLETISSITASPGTPVCLSDNSVVMHYQWTFRALTTYTAIKT
jgi:hypothetical protein